MTPTVTAVSSAHRGAVSAIEAVGLGAASAIEAARPDAADEVLTCDAVVVGAGAAGLSVAAGMRTGRVLLLSDSPIGAGTASQYAQGGIAAAVDEGDTASAHAADTLAVGGGLNDADAVAALTGAGPDAVRLLEQLGMPFERTRSRRWALGREAGHGRPRILHAGGDATGRALVSTLARAVTNAAHVEVLAPIRAERLLTAAGRVVGVLASTRDGRRFAVVAGEVVLATGGLGHCYARTTNPASARGEGLVLAADAGARLIDMEFVQFHPTALDVDRDPLPLLSEALRGAGACILDADGRRLLERLHPDAELAPRDVVARALWRHQREGGHAFLDLTGLADLPGRFPTAVAACRTAGLDPTTEPVPITPAAHYHMGGIAVDAEGGSSAPGLSACGEVACTGAHGANRLASNSLLEAVVVGGRVAARLRAEACPPPSPERVRTALRNASERSLALTGAPSAEQRARAVLWSEAGLVRDEAGLSAARERLDALAATGGAPALVGRYVVTAALRRRESRGAHHRTDHPKTDARPRRWWITAPQGAAPVANPASPMITADRASAAATVTAEPASAAC